MSKSHVKQNELPTVELLETEIQKVTNIATAHEFCKNTLGKSCPSLKIIPDSEFIPKSNIFYGGGGGGTLFKAEFKASDISSASATSSASSSTTATTPCLALLLPDRKRTFIDGTRTAVLLSNNNLSNQDGIVKLIGVCATDKLRSHQDKLGCDLVLLFEESNNTSLSQLLAGNPDHTLSPNQVGVLLLPIARAVAAIHKSVPDAEANHLSLHPMNLLVFKRESSDPICAGLDFKLKLAAGSTFGLAPAPLNDCGGAFTRVDFQNPDFYLPPEIYEHYLAVDPFNFSRVYPNTRVAGVAGDVYGFCILFCRLLLNIDPRALAESSSSANEEAEASLSSFSSRVAQLAEKMQTEMMDKLERVLREQQQQPQPQEPTQPSPATSTSCSNSFSADASSSNSSSVFFDKICGDLKKVLETTISPSDCLAKLGNAVAEWHEKSLEELKRQVNNNRDQKDQEQLMKERALQEEEEEEEQNERKSNGDSSQRTIISLSKLERQIQKVCSIETGRQFCEEFLSTKNINVIPSDDLSLKSNVFCGAGGGGTLFKAEFKASDISSASATSSASSSTTATTKECLALLLPDRKRTFIDGGRTAVLLSSLSNQDGIIKLIGVCATDKLRSHQDKLGCDLVLLFEESNNTSLSQLLAGNPEHTLSPNQVGVLLLPIARAVAAIHKSVPDAEANHLALHPMNLLVFKRESSDPICAGLDFKLKLAAGSTFGLAPASLKDCDDELIPVDLRNLDFYLPPEVYSQLRGDPFSLRPVYPHKRVAGVSGDVYGFGVLLFRLLLNSDPQTLVVPPKSSSSSSSLDLVDIIVQIVDSVRKAMISKLNQSISATSASSSFSDSLAQLAIKCLQKEKERLQTIDYLLEPLAAPVLTKHFLDDHETSSQVSSHAITPGNARSEASSTPSDPSSNVTSLGSSYSTVMGGGATSDFSTAAVTPVAKSLDKEQDPEVDINTLTAELEEKNLTKQQLFEQRFPELVLDKESVTRVDSSRSFIKSGGFGSVHRGTLTRTLPVKTSSVTGAGAGGTKQQQQQQRETIQVAIKIPNDNVKDPVEEVYREANVLARFNKQGCAGVVKLYGVVFLPVQEQQQQQQQQQQEQDENEGEKEKEGKEIVSARNEKPALVMELAEGSLADIFDKIARKERNPLTPAEILNYAFQLAEITASLHSARPLIIHKDVKPGNVLVFQNGKVLKITDVGLSKEANHGDTTSMGPGGGTKYYNSFEQFVYPCRISAASDVFSLGMTLAELLTGQKPHRFAPENVLALSCFKATEQTRDSILHHLRAGEFLVSGGEGGGGKEKLKFLVPVIEHCLQTRASERPCTGRVVLLELLEHALLIDPLLLSGKQSDIKQFLFDKFTSSGITTINENNQLMQEQEGLKEKSKKFLLKRIDEAILAERRRKQKISEHDQLSFQERAPEIFMCMDRREVPKAVELILSAGEKQLEDVYTYYYDSKKYPLGVRIRASFEVGDVNVVEEEKEQEDEEEQEEKEVEGKEETQQSTAEVTRLQETYFDLVPDFDVSQQVSEATTTVTTASAATSSSSSSVVVNDSKSSSSFSSATSAAGGGGGGNTTTPKATKASSLSSSAAAFTTEKKKVSIAHRAVALGQIDVLKALVERKAKCLHLRDGDNFTPLELSVSEKENRNFENSAVYFISDKTTREEELKSDFEAPTKHIGYHTNGSKPINLAAMYSSRTVMEAFFEYFPKKFTPSSPPSSSRPSSPHEQQKPVILTPLLQAVDYGNLEVIDFLMNKEKFIIDENNDNNPNNNNNNNNILFTAIENKNNTLEVLELVLEKLHAKLGKSEFSALLRHRAANGETLLHYCVIKDKSAEVFDFLASHDFIKKENLFQVKDSLGLTPAQRAMQPVRVPLLEVCAQHGVLSMDLMASSRKSLRFHAEKNKDLAEMLKKYNVPDKQKEASDEQEE